MKGRIGNLPKVCKEEILGKNSRSSSRFKSHFCNDDTDREPKRYSLCSEKRNRGSDASLIRILEALGSSFYKCTKNMHIRASQEKCIFRLVICSST